MGHGYGVVIPEGEQMSAKDTYHNAVKNALIKDGWTITHDPLTLAYGRKDVYVDLGCQRALAAERGDEKIAVEIKSFMGTSEIRDLEVAVGQYVFYRSLLARLDPKRKLFLAVSDDVLAGPLAEPIARPVLEDLHIALVAFNPEREEIVKWIP
jgi:hypothetical protein